VKLLFKKLFLFLSISVLTLLIFNFWSNQIVINTMQSKSNLDYLIIGDSHTQNGINFNIDSLICINLSASAESYFYSYVKVKHLIDEKVKIRNIILNYGAYSLSDKIDSIWLFDKKNYLSKTRSYFPFINFNDFYDYTNLLNFDFTIYADLFIEIFYQSFYNLERYYLLGKKPFIGEYTPNSSILNLNDSISIIDNKGNSDVQMKYLNKIIELSKKNEIKLFLVCTPTFLGGPNKLKKGIKGPFYYFDYGPVFLGQNEYFSDYVHLNEKGSLKFSNILINDILHSNLNLDSN